MIFHYLRKRVKSMVIAFLEQHIIDYYELLQQLELQREWEADNQHDDEMPWDAAMEQWYINCRDALRE